MIFACRGFERAERQLAAEAAGGAASGGQLAWYGDSGYGTGDLREATATRAPGGDQALAAQALGRGRLHPRWLHRQCGRRNRDLPSRDHPADHRPQCCDLRGCLPGLCPAREMHHRKDGCTLHLHADDGLLGLRYARTTWPTGPTLSVPSPRSPPGAGAASNSATAGRPKQRLAQAPHRRAEPAHPARPRPRLAGRHLAAGYL